MHIDEHLDSRPSLARCGDRPHARTRHAGPRHCGALLRVERICAGGGQAHRRAAWRRTALRRDAADRQFVSAGAGGRPVVAARADACERVACGGRSVAAASDKFRSVYSVGSGDLLEVARWTMVAGHFGLPNSGRAFDMVSAVPASIIGHWHDWGIQYRRARGSVDHGRARIPTNSSPTGRQSRGPGRRKTCRRGAVEKRTDDAAERRVARKIRAADSTLNWRRTMKLRCSKGSPRRWRPIRRSR